MNDVVKVTQWENENMGIKIWSIKIRKRFWFFGKELALALEYTDPKDAIQDHVGPEDKKSIEELLGKNYKTVLIQNLSSGGKNPPVEFFQKLRANQKLINELGLISFCTRSRKERAVPFQRWVYKTIQEIRETGFYTLPGGSVENPLELVTKIQTLERRIESIQRETKTCDKSTQTTKTIDSFELRSRLEKSIRKNKEIEMELKKILRKTNSSSNSDSSSYSSPPRYYSSDSE